MIGGFLQRRVFPQHLHQTGGHRRLSGAYRRLKTAWTTAATTARRLLGLRGLVFKSHGSADEFAFEQALNRAYDAARNNLLDRVQARIAHAAPLLARRRAERRRWTQPRSATLDDTIFPHHRHRQLPAAAPRDQRRPGRRTGGRGRRNLRPVDRRAHRHPGAPLRRAGRHAAATWALQAARQALEAAGPQRRRDRPDHRRHVHAGHGVPVGGLHPAAQAGHRRLRRPSTCRRCAAASSTR